MDSGGDEAISNLNTVLIETIDPHFFLFMCVSCYLLATSRPSKQAWIYKGQTGSSTY